MSRVQLGNALLVDCPGREIPEVFKGPKRFPTNIETPDPHEWIWWRGIATRIIADTGMIPTPGDDQFPWVSGYRFKCAYDRLFLDLVSLGWDPLAPLPPAPPGTVGTDTFTGPSLQFRIWLGRREAIDPVADITWTPTCWRSSQEPIDGGLLLSISGIVFTDVYIFGRVVQDEQRWVNSNISARVGFQGYVDHRGCSSRVIASTGKFGAITAVQRTTERLTNLP